MNSDVGTHLPDDVIVQLPEEAQEFARHCRLEVDEDSRTVYLADVQTGTRFTWLWKEELDNPRLDLTLRLIARAGGKVPNP